MDNAHSLKLTTLSGNHVATIDVKVEGNKTTVTVDEVGCPPVTYTGVNVKDALNTVVIDGHTLYDACKNERKKEGERWGLSTTAPKGFRFANFDGDEREWTACYQISGLEYLHALGYKIERS